MIIAGLPLSLRAADHEIKAGDSVQSRSHYSLSDGDQFAGLIRCGQEPVVRQLDTAPSTG
ncbi:MAG TPA: hypothetical protein DCG12_04030 [Planctomycetaceae bacterium]|nr:hypothetical protein [Planctomycetaceae bacterium]